MVSVVVAMQPYPADHARTMKMQLYAQCVLAFHAAGEIDEMKLDTLLAGTM